MSYGLWVLNKINILKKRKINITMHPCQTVSQTCAGRMAKPEVLLYSQKKKWGQTARNRHMVGATRKIQIGEKKKGSRVS